MNNPKHQRDHIRKLRIFTKKSIEIVKNLSRKQFLKSTNKNMVCLTVIVEYV